jgi:hypothetical protein
LIYYCSLLLCTCPLIQSSKNVTIIFLYLPFLALLLLLILKLECIEIPQPVPRLSYRILPLCKLSYRSRLFRHTRRQELSTAFRLSCCLRTEHNDLNIVIIHNTVFSYYITLTMINLSCCSVRNKCFFLSFFQSIRQWSQLTHYLVTLYL